MPCLALFSEVRSYRAAGNRVFWPINPSAGQRFAFARLPHPLGVLELGVLRQLAAGRALKQQRLA